ncbi:UDP-2,3-diacylglucosamine diphosphatase [Fluctibacter halophilus]
MGTHYKTVWLSDIHLGNKDCKADYLLNFLSHTHIDTLYLVGDIIDMWAMQNRMHWPDSHNQVLHRLMTLSQQGTRIVYLPGNHDAPLQKYDGMAFSNVTVKREHIHVTAQGKRLLVLHGDQFDEEVCFGRIHAWIGDKGYDLLLFLNRWYNRLQTARGRPYWSLAGYIKGHIKGAAKAIARYRQACIDRARTLGLDGVVCGHIHHPEILHIDGLTYFNDGDWIENCSALTEDHQGNLQLLRWTSQQGRGEVIDLHTEPSSGCNVGKPQAA